MISTVASDLHKNGNSFVFVKLKVKLPKSHPQFVNIPSYKNHNLNLFMVHLTDKTHGLLTIFDTSAVDTKLNTFNDTLQSLLDIHAP